MSMIYGKDVRLRAMERNDMRHNCDWVNDPEITAWLNLFIPLSHLDEESWFEAGMQCPQEQKPLAIEIPIGDD